MGGMIVKAKYTCLMSLQMNLVFLDSCGYSAITKAHRTRPSMLCRAALAIHEVS